MRENLETGESEKVLIVISRTTTSSTYESEVAHSHLDWAEIITAVASVVTAGATLYGVLKGD